MYIWRRCLLLTYLKIAMSKLSSRMLATNKNNAMMTVTIVPPNLLWSGVLKAVDVWLSTRTKC